VNEEALAHWGEGGGRALAQKKGKLYFDSVLTLDHEILRVVIAQKITPEDIF